MVVLPMVVIMIVIGLHGLGMLVCILVEELLMGELVMAASLWILDCASNFAPVAPVGQVLSVSG